MGIQPSGPGSLRPRPGWSSRVEITRLCDEGSDCVRAGISGSTANLSGPSVVAHSVNCLICRELNFCELCVRPAADVIGVFCRPTAKGNRAREAHVRIPGVNL